jgi:hypothetical protein
MLSVEREHLRARSAIPKAKNELHVRTQAKPKFRPALVTQETKERI